MPADARYNFDDDSPAYQGGEPSLHTDNADETPRANRGKPAALGIFVFLGAATIVFGIVSIGNSIKAPFAAKVTIVDVGKVVPGDGDENVDPLSDESLKKSDTDLDGLSDFDEMRTFHTSPYLKDTNGNSYDDRTELITEHDPLLKKGNTTPSVKVTPPLGGLLPPSGDTAAPPSNAPLDQSAAFDLLQNPTPVKLRELLVNQGLPKEKIDALTDDALLNLYAESLAEAQAKTGVPIQSQSPAVQQPSLDQSGPSVFDILGENPSAKSVREMLLQSGSFTQDQLSTFDDAAIQIVYRQALQKHRKDQLQKQP